MMRANVIKAIVGNNALRLLKPDTEKVKETLTEATWLNHEVWKSVTTSLVRGVRDQSSDFNKWKEEVRLVPELSHHVLLPAAR